VATKVSFVTASRGRRISVTFGVSISVLM